MEHQESLVKWVSDSYYLNCKNHNTQVDYLFMMLATFVLLNNIGAS